MLTIQVMNYIGFAIPVYNCCTCAKEAIKSVEKFLYLLMQDKYSLFY